MMKNKDATRQTQLACTESWLNKQVDGWINNWNRWVLGGEGSLNVSRSRPSTDDKRPPLQLSQVDPHLCTVACLPHPNLDNVDRGDTVKNCN